MELNTQFLVPHKKNLDIVVKHIKDRFNQGFEQYLQKFSISSDYLNFLRLTKVLQHVTTLLPFAIAIMVVFVVVWIHL